MKGSSEERLSETGDEESLTRPAVGANQVNSYIPHTVAMGL